MSSRPVVYHAFLLGNAHTLLPTKLQKASAIDMMPSAFLIDTGLPTLWKEGTPAALHRTFLILPVAHGLSEAGAMDSHTLLGISTVAPSRLGPTRIVQQTAIDNRA